MVNVLFELQDIWDCRQAKLRASATLLLQEGGRHAKVDHLTLMEINSIRPLLPQSLDMLRRLNTCVLPLNMGESDDEDLETLRAAALQSLSVKAEVESHPSQPQWKAVGGRSGMGKPFQAMTGFRGGRNPRKPYNRGRGACYNGRGGVSMFGWAEVQQPISRSNLISIIPFNPEDNDSSVPHPSSSVQATAKLAQEEEDQSSVPTKFSRVERSDSESSDEDEKELQDSAEEVEAEAEDPDVILMQDEDSLGKLLDEFEHELQEEQPGTKPDKKPVAPSKKKSTETFRKSTFFSRFFTPMPNEHYMEVAQMILSVAGEDIPRPGEIRVILK
ncbi:hypothetical protein B566_EDAN002220, partial [Ephemera danica]